MRSNSAMPSSPSGARPSSLTVLRHRVTISAWTPLYVSWCCCAAVRVPLRGGADLRRSDCDSSVRCAHQRLCGNCCRALARLMDLKGSLASRRARGALNLHQDTGDRRPLPLQSKKLFLIKSRVSLPGQKHHADFLDPLCTHIRFFGGVYPINKISALVRRKILPLCLCLRKRTDGFVKIHGHECITAGAPLAGGEPRRDALDTAFAGLGLFRGLYPTDEVPARDRRKVTPLSLCPRRRSENLAKIRWHSGF